MFYILENNSVYERNGDDVFPDDKIMTDFTTFEKVIGFSYKNQNRKYKKILIRTESSFVSGLPQQLCFVDHKHEKSLESLSLDDTLWLNGKKDKIISIENIEENGYVMPLTDSGTIVINGYKFSCYTTDINSKVIEQTVKVVKHIPLETIRQQMLNKVLSEQVKFS